MIGISQFRLSGIGIVAGCAALAVASSATAQPPSSSNSAYGSQSGRDAIASFVETVTDARRDDQVARWEEPVCPAVFGLQDDQNRYIADTILGVAGAIGIGMPAPGCDANVVVAFVDDPAETIAEWSTRSPLAFSSLVPAERSRLAVSSGPVLSWAYVDERGVDGRLVFEPENPNSARLADQRTLIGVIPSRALRATQRALRGRFVLIDRQRIAGMNLVQLSGFATMAGLASVDTDRPVEPASSILNLFHASDGLPADLSPIDIAYLRALYGSDIRRDAATQRGQMVGQMVNQLEASAN